MKRLFNVYESFLPKFWFVFFDLGQSGILREKTTGKRTNVSSYFNLTDNKNFFLMDIPQFWHEHW